MGELYLRLQWSPVHCTTSANCTNLFKDLQGALAPHRRILGEDIPMK
jgi:hypothetical protein